MTAKSQEGTTLLPTRHKDGILQQQLQQDEDHLSRQFALQEAKKLIQLAIPTVAIQMGAVLPPLLITSFIGRTYGSVHLDGFLLASLTGNLFTLSLLQGLFSAADTLSPQAFGANNEREVGLIAMRGFLGSLMVMIPINVVLVTHMGPILEFVGIDPEVSHYAWQWYRIYAVSLPFYALFQVTWKFLSAQSVMLPCVVAVGVSSVVVLPVALVVWTYLLGYFGAAWALVTFQATEAVLLLGFVWWKQPHRPETWPGLACWRDALEKRRFWSYIVSWGVLNRVNLVLGLILSLRSIRYSEQVAFWRARNGYTGNYCHS